MVPLSPPSTKLADWALDGVLPDTISNVLTMGATSYDYDVVVFGISFHYSTEAR